MSVGRPGHMWSLPCIVEGMSFTALEARKKVLQDIIHARVPLNE